VTGWECPRCGETRSATSRCHCAAVGRCVWCGLLLDGYPKCDCPDGPEDDDWADREERRRERAAECAKAAAAMTPKERERDGA